MTSVPSVSCGHRPLAGKMGISVFAHGELIDAVPAARIEGSDQAVLTTEK